MNIVCNSENSELLCGVTAICEALQRSETFYLQTSGTTGQPKQVAVDLADAFRKKKGGSREERWLLCYHPSRWAGVSVILHALKSSCTLCVPRSTSSFDDLLQGIFELHPTHLSCTPSLFRNLVRADEKRALSLAPIRQVTFGGEAATQSVLNLAASILPQARVSHIYASTEFGDICCVSDGRAGIPQNKFAAATLTSEGELIWDGLPTGDFWDLVDGRYQFRGRREEIINVGGNKISPLRIEEFAIQQGAIAARAFGISNPLMGSLVGLEYVGGPDTREMAKKFRAAFEKYACPASLKKVDKIEITMAAKTQRINL